MIQYDYLLRLLEEFARNLARIREMRLDNQPRAAGHALDREFLLATGADRESLLRLSTNEILARLLRMGSSYDAQTRAFMLVALFDESSKLAAEEGDSRRALENQLKALTLLLDFFERYDPTETPRFVPSLDAIAANLHAESVPVELHARLMRHYERLGRYADAENELFHLVDAVGKDADLATLGHGFYRRILELNDETLKRGDLPRTEALEGQAQFLRRVAA